MSRAIAYLTDVEGQWSKLADFCRANPYVSLSPEGALRVAEGACFVFGGDAIDRGPDARRIVALLAGAAEATPERVVLLAGNRDINKIRLVRELAGAPPRAAPPELAAGPPGALLRFIFAHTMGASRALDHRRAELRAAGAACDDDAAAQSYLDDLRPDGAHSRYLAACRLAFRSGETLFVHGVVGERSFGFVPGHDAPFEDVDAWIEALNAFYAARVASFRAPPERGARAAPPYADLVAYQAPCPGQRDNPESVVYGRPTDEADNPMLPPRAVIAKLRAGGVRRVVLGHTPSGDCPALLRDGDGFELVLGDNSYGRIEPGSQIFLEPGLRIAGETQLDEGTRAPIALTADAEPCDSPIGLRDAAQGWLVKARLARGDYLGFRSHPGRRVEQVAFTAGELARRTLVPPFRAGAPE